MQPQHLTHCTDSMAQPPPNQATPQALPDYPATRALSNLIQHTIESPPLREDELEIPTTLETNYPVTSPAANATLGHDRISNLPGSTVHL